MPNLKAGSFIYSQQNFCPPKSFYLLGVDLAAYKTKKPFHLFQY